MQDRQPPVAAMARRTDVGITRKPRRPGIVHRVATGIGTETGHDLQHPAGMIGLFEDDARGRDTLLDAGRIVDRVGETRGTGEFAVNEARHQAHELGPIARGRIARRGQEAALGQIVLDGDDIGICVGHRRSLPMPAERYWS